MENKKVTQLSDKRAEGMMMEYVRIRHSMTGVERIIALTQWAIEADRLYRPNMTMTPTAMPSAQQ